jgi:hypothetical protein
MFGTRQLIISVEQDHGNNNSPSTHTGYLRELCQQAKQVSQIIAYIWRWGDETDEKYSEQKGNAIKLKSYFEHPTSGEEPGENLLKLFKANPKDEKDTTEEANLLRAVFFIDKQGQSIPGYDTKLNCIQCR